MPYSNVPKHLWGKMDSCVKRVMARQGIEKPRAIAICHASVVKGDGEVDVSNQRQKRKMRQRAALAAAQLTDEPEADAVAEALTPEEAQAAGEKQLADGKDLVEVEIYRPYDGATSWQELDEYLKAREMSWATREVTDQLDSLIKNVLESDEVEDKGAAISKLAAGFNQRVQEAQEEEKAVTDCECGCREEDSESLITRFLRAFRPKAELGGASRNDLPDSAFAYIEPGGKKDDGGKTVPRSLRHYPIHDAAHVRNALARAGAAIKKGGKTAEIARRAMPKIRAAAKKLGVAVSGNGKKSGFWVTKTAGGNYRWFGWVTNKWRDNDAAAAPEKGGEIITDAAHKEFVGWLDAHPDMAPQSWVWHTAGTARKSRADWWDYAHGQLVMSGPLTPEEGAAADKVYGDIDAGMSHGFFLLDRDPADKTAITKYRTFEVSDLPLEHAANPWTDFESIRKEAVMFTEEKRAHLVALLGEDVVAQLEGETSDREKALLEAQVAFKEKAPPAPEPAPAASAAAPEAAKAPVPEPVAPVQPSTIEELVKAAGLKDLDAFLRTLIDTVAKQGATIAEMKTALEKVTREDAEKIADQFKPRIADAGYIWKLQPSKAKETQLGEGDADVPDKPPSVDPAPKGLEWVRQNMGGALPMQ